RGMCGRCRVDGLVELSGLATECHTLGFELEIGDGRADIFEVCNVVRTLCGGAYAREVGRRMDPRLAYCDAEVDEEGDDWDEDDD
ncbi:hypothetical protein, partial [Ralstonia insidiosa]|uniref:hypothetical protein n=1 Tax=Ralstonia insidiosa TaxID=190721 RepID=UPI001BAFA401